MNRPLAPTITNLFPAAFLAILAASPAATATEDRLVAFADRYEFRNAAYRRLGPLEEAVRAARPTALRIDICGTDAARAFKAAAHRFSDLMLVVIVHSENARTCRRPVAATPAALYARPLSDIDDGEVERYWQRTMP